MNPSKKIYAKGIYFNKLPDTTPDTVKKWKKGSISVHAENFKNFLAENAEFANNGYLRFDLTLNEKDGEKFFSFVLNTWKPEKKEGDKNWGIPDDADMDATFGRQNDIDIPV
jgi:hypothetical protein